MPTVLAAEGASSTAAVLASALKDVTLSGITSEIVGVLPIVIPVVLTVLALRKGISFLMGTLRGA